MTGEASHLGERAGTPRTETKRAALQGGLWYGPLTAAGYYLGASLGFALTLPSSPVSTLWPPNAILLAGLLLTPFRSWPGILACVFIAHLGIQVQAGVPIPMMLSWFVSNCTEALIGALLLRRLARPILSFQRFSHVVLFITCAGLLGPFLSSFLDAGLVILNGFGTATYTEVWQSRFFGNVLATLTLVPVIVTLVRQLPRAGQVRWRVWVESTAALTLLLAVCWAIFLRPEAGSGAAPPTIYAVVPVLVFIAVRFGPAGGHIAMLMCAVVAIGGAVYGNGPFVTQTAGENTLAIQLFLTATQLSLLLLTAVMSERVRAEERARTGQEQLALALNAAQLAAWDWTIGDDEALASAATWSMLGIAEPPSHKFERYLDLVHPADRRAVAEAVADAVNMPAGLELEYRLVLPDRTLRWMLSRGKTLLDQNDSLRMVGVNVDITARREADLEIQEQRREVAHLGRVALVGELSVVLTHELKQPLASILLNARTGQRLLACDPPDLAEVKETLADIAEADERATSVIERLRTFLHKGLVTLEHVDANDLVTDVLRIARPDVIARSVVTTVRLSSELPVLTADRVQLEQVLLNLIVNSCDALQLVDVSHRRLDVSTELLADGAVRFCVTDSGPGIPEQEVDAIFAPFVTSKPQGLGLGLSICRSIVTSHGGKLEATNNPGGGASFWMSIPPRFQAVQHHR